jgi:predicted nucleic acid-binding protein
MTKPTVYLETTILGYGASEPSRDLITAARQQITRAWFAGAVDRYELFVSQPVVREASAGDEHAAADRLALIEGIPLLAVTDEAGELAAKLVDEGAVPTKAAEDALHLALAAVHGIQFLLTWNVKHIANATMRQAIERVCRDSGFEPPVICTPEELEDDDTDR